MTGNAQITAHHFHKRGIAFGGSDRDHVTVKPKQETTKP
jgi:hypothetical protein